MAEIGDGRGQLGPALGQIDSKEDLSRVSLLHLAKMQDDDPLTEERRVHNTRKTAKKSSPRTNPLCTACQSESHPHGYGALKLHIKSGLQTTRCKHGPQKVPDPDRLTQR